MSNVFVKLRSNRLTTTKYVLSCNVFKYKIIFKNYFQALSALYFVNSVYLVTSKMMPPSKQKSVCLDDIIYV